MEPFVVTNAAAAEIRRSIDLGEADGIGLRIAIRRTETGEFDYVMGFDERAPGDFVVVSRGIDVLLSEDDHPLLDGTTLDYVELEPEQYKFIFLNPQDPNYSPPTEC
jgi:iron-sulfur cluster assembly protein